MAFQISYNTNTNTDPFNPNVMQHNDSIVCVSVLFGDGEWITMTNGGGNSIGVVNNSPEDSISIDYFTPAGDWLQLRLTDFTATAIADSTLSLPNNGAAFGADVFMALQDSTLDQGADYQNLAATVSFRTGGKIVPEPSRAILLLMGLASAIIARRRR